MAKGQRVKHCTKCNVEKSLEEFPFKTSERKARRSVCKQCATLRKQSVEYKRSEKERLRHKRNQQPEYRIKQIEQSRKYGQTIRGRSVRLFHAAKHRATIGNLSFELCVAHIEVVLMIGVCQKTGIPFDLNSPIRNNFNPYAPSVDRKNPYGGYTVDNVQLVCNAYNIAKNQFSDEQFF